MNWRSPSLLTTGLLGAIFLVFIAGYVVLAQRQPAPARPDVEPPLPSATTIPKPTVVTPTTQRVQPTPPSTSLLEYLPLWAPIIKWQDAKPDTVYVDGKPIAAFSRTGMGISSESLIPEQTRVDEELTKRGWRGERTGDGPGSSVTTYIKLEDRKQRIIVLHYQTKATVVSAAKEPVQFEKCPCPYEATVSLSDPF